MGKKKIGSIESKTLVRGDVNLLGNNEILVSKDEGYTVLREKKDSKINTYIVIPVEDFYGTDSGEKV